MKIQSTLSRPQQKSKPLQAPKSNRVSRTAESVKDGVVFGAAGAVPLVGAGLNMMVSIGSQFNENSTLAKVAAGAMLSNLAGTASLAGGLVFGSEVATYAGLGLLGVSGLVTGYAAASRSA